MRGVQICNHTNLKHLHWTNTDVYYYLFEAKYCAASFLLSTAFNHEVPLQRHQPRANDGAADAIRRTAFPRVIPYRAVLTASDHE